MAKIIFYEIFKQRKERQLAAKEMEDRQKRINRLVAHAKSLSWGNDNAKDDS